MKRMEKPVLCRWGAAAVTYTQTDKQTIGMQITWQGAPEIESDWAFEEGRNVANKHNPGTALQTQKYNS